MLYSDDENPFLYKLSPYVQRFMRKHREMYHIKNHAMADGVVALFALESFLKKYNRIIVDWNVDEDSDIIIISKKSEESLQKRKEGYEIFKRIIGYKY